MEKIIEIKNLTKEIQGNIILNNISLDIFKGQIMGIIGPNGAGKTTLIRNILGLYKPTKGTVKINISTEKTKIKNQIGFMLLIHGFKL